MAKDVVFIFDEFDRTIFALSERQERRKKRDSFSLFSDDEDYSFSRSHKHSPKNNTSKTPMQLAADAGKTDNTVSSDYTDLIVDDLLELLQGAVPLEGAIIIATTNKLEEIKQICPALFRAGRLTPVYFGCADSEFINQLTENVFKRKLILDVKPDILQPAAILEFATSTFDKENLEESFDKFKNKLLPYCESVNALTT